MRTKLVIFDLDGTLINSIGGLSAACNAALESNGFPLHSDAEYCLMVGNGIAKLVERAMPEALRTESSINALKMEFLRIYTNNIALNTVPYDGVVELLFELESMGVMLAVASNKFHSGTVELVDTFFSEREFIAVCGNREGVPLKPDPQIVDDIISKAGVLKSEVLYVGDSEVDIQTARNAGVTSVGVSWGLRGEQELIAAKADVIIDKALQLLDYFKE